MITSAVRSKPVKVNVFVEGDPMQTAPNAVRLPVLITGEGAAVLNLIAEQPVASPVEFPGTTFQ